MFKFILLFFAFILFFIFDVGYGIDGLNLKELYYLFNEGKQSPILINLRLPRALAALLCGAMLGLSGAMMQSILKNALASPYTLGVSQAGAFGASLYIIILSNLGYGGILDIVGFAFVSSLFCIFIIIFLSKNLNSSSVILLGVALGALFSAMTMMMQFFATDIDAASSLFWSFGDLGKANYTNISILTLCFFPLFLFTWANHWKFDAIGFGEYSAISRGVNLTRFRYSMLIISTLMTTLTVSYFGIIGFVGLVAPHVTRLLFGASYKYIIPLSTICGSILLSFADIISRALFSPIIIPVGIIMSFIGVPLLIILLIKKGKNIA